MMKRLMCLALALMMMVLTMGALADTPKPISTVDYDSLSDPGKNVHHYLLLCQDTWHDVDGKLGNTDGIVLVTLDKQANRVMLTSIIRDALIAKPDTGNPGRINYIAKNYSPEQLCRTISEHLGVKVEKYILFNFSHIQNIIDILGGVDITITNAEANYLTRYAISPTSTTPRVTKGGTYHFGGHAAVIYMRIRKVGQGHEFMRTQRVRTVLSTLADSCRTITLDEAYQLANEVLEHSSMTNMSLEDMREAASIAFELRGCTIEELRIPQDEDVHPITYVGMAVQELDWEACRARMANFLQSSFLVMDDDEE